MKKYITEENNIDTRALLDRFKNSPPDIQLAIQFAKECFPNLDINSFGPGGYPNNNGVNCIKFKSQNPANSSNPIGYLCDSNDGKLVYLSQAEDDKKAKGITPVPAKDTKWSCSVLSTYKNALLGPDLKNIADALKLVYKENIKNSMTIKTIRGYHTRPITHLFTYCQSAN